MNTLRTLTIALIQFSCFLQSFPAQTANLFSLNLDRPATTKTIGDTGRPDEVRRSNDTNANFAVKIDLQGPPGSGEFGKYVKTLPDGNFLVADPGYDDTSIVDVGAVHLFDGSTNLILSTLKGTSPGDKVGSGGITVLTNGNFVVSSPDWNFLGAEKRGAVTFCNPQIGIPQNVSVFNSLYGGLDNDLVGSGGVFALSNGNYVVASPRWDYIEANTRFFDVGAATWGNGTTGSIGEVEKNISIHGIETDDRVAIGGVSPLTNGNYVVVSPSWRNSLGAVTFAPGQSNTSIAVTSDNSLIGFRAGDSIGSGGVTALTNGSYVVSSPFWDDNVSNFVNCGATTWSNGTSGITGPVVRANSLTALSPNSRISSGGITALANGNYVVNSPFFSSTTFPVGAATWRDGNSNTTGFVTTNNSLVGRNSNDSTGARASIPLSNGDYVVLTPNYDQFSPFSADVGAATWANGLFGTVGVVSNTSVLGSLSADFVGSGGGVGLDDGSYVVISPRWSSNDVGAVTRINPASSTPLVTSGNSFIGISDGDQVGSGGIVPVSNARYIIKSPQFSGSRGAITYVSGVYNGMLSDENSVIGTAAAGGPNMVVDFDYVHDQMIVGRPADNIVTLFRPNSACNYSLSPTSPQSVTASGGLLSVDVTTTKGCNWTALTNNSWITVTAGSTGNGSGIVSIQIAANTGSARSGSLTIAGQTYVINQDGASACTYTLTPTSTTISDSGGSGNFGVSSGVGCTWSATSNVSWITTSSTGSGSGTVTFTVAANSGTARIGSILIAGQTFTVNQSAATGAPIVPVKISSADSSLSDFFGNSVSISGSAAIVGANGHAVGGNDDQGAAYIYMNNGTSWVLQQKLTMPAGDAQAAAQFGYSVAISGDTVIVGSPTQDNAANVDQGAAYVYVRSGTTWTFQQRLRQSDGAAGDNFGWSVAIDGDTAVVGAYLDDESVYTNCGSAYAYLRTGTTWAEESRMVSSERTSNSQMGYSVGISGATIIIGARFAQSSTSSPDFGSAYIFTPAGGSPRIWTQRSILTAPQRGAGDQFGFSVGVSGNTALVGARFDDVGSNADQGSAYIFSGSGNTWSFQRQLIANDGIANDEFGNAVSINGDRLVVGAPQNSSRNGKAYLFTGIGANWTQLPVVVAPDGSPNDLYGSSVAINGTNAVVGAVFDDARRGSVYFLTGIPGARTKTSFDFDGDGKTDIGIFRPSDGSWWHSRSTDNVVPVYTFGNGNDVVVPGDYTGDGKSDIAVFRPSNGNWFVQRSEDNSFFSFPFGTSGDIPAPADYDGDGKSDAAVFRPSSGTWFISRSSDNGTTIVGFGSTGDKPVVADYDGDGKADIAIFRPADGSWWYVKSSTGLFSVFLFGTSTDKPVPGDWTGDGKADIAVFRPSNGQWFVQRSEDNTFFSFPFGTAGDIAAPGDYDGDGRFDPAVFRPTSATWFINRTTSGVLISGFGAPTDVPLPSVFTP